MSNLNHYIDRIVKYITNPSKDNQSSICHNYTARFIQSSIRNPSNRLNYYVAFWGQKSTKMVIHSGIIDDNLNVIASTYNYSKESKLNPDESLIMLNDDSAELVEKINLNDFIHTYLESTGKILVHSGRMAGKTTMIKHLMRKHNEGTKR